MDASSPHEPVDERPALVAYVRPIADETLDATIQRTAVRACARGEQLGAPEIFEEAEAFGRTAFAHVAHLVEVAQEEREQSRPGEAAPPPTVIVATVAVLGDSALERARRVLLLEAAGARLIFADGVPPEDALRGDWEDRPGEERRRERARDAMRRKALRAQVLGRPPYGYVVEDRTLVPHPRESQVVARIFDEYVHEGEGLRRIAGALNRDGIKTRLGRPWSPGSVRTVLRNPTYTGLYRRLGVAVPAAHEALVDRGTFQVVQRRMLAKRTSRVQQERHTYLLAGLLRCGLCGSPMIGDRRATEDGVQQTYRCESAVNQGRCRAKSRRAEIIEETLREELGSTASHHPVAARPAPTPDTSARRQRLERRLTESLERWTAGEWRYSELAKRVAPTVRALQADETPPEGLAIAADEARRQLVREWDDLEFEELRALLQAAVAEIVVSGSDIRLTLRR
jgi:site-specific DNA recombinase